MLNLVKILNAKEKMNAAEETQIRAERELAFAIVGLNRTPTGLVLILTNVKSYKFLPAHR